MARGQKTAQSEKPVENMSGLKSELPRNAFGSSDNVTVENT